MFECFSNSVICAAAIFRVKLAVHNDTKECVAVKIVHLDGKNGLTEDCLKKEVWLVITIHKLIRFVQVCIMRMLKHNNIVRFYGERTCGMIHYLFLEYVDGGELFDRIGTQEVTYY